MRHQQKSITIDFDKDICQVGNERSLFCIMYHRVEINKDRPNLIIS